LSEETEDEEETMLQECRKIMTMKLPYNQKRGKRPKQRKEMERILS
jgi:hypothetical protein